METALLDKVLRVAFRSAGRVVLAPGALARLPAVLPPGTRRAALLADARVDALHGASVRRVLADAGVDATTVTFPPGERSKTRATLQRVQDRVLAASADRRTVVVGLGGGVATDLAGAAAATLLRGLPLVQVPTTLLGAVDAAIGGKNAVDTPAGKNLVGTFHWPAAVLIDPVLLGTLPPREIRAGLAEVVKHGVIGDPSILDALEVTARRAVRVPSPELVARAVRVKLRVVALDPYEAGLRRTLNFGHTVAHAIEAASGLRVRHGPAVAAGMVVEARVAVRLLGFPAQDALRLARLVAALGLPDAPPCAFRDALPFLAVDKKNRAGQVRMALPRAPGRMEEAGGEFAVPVPLDLLEACWHAG